MKTAKKTSIKKQTFLWSGYDRRSIKTNGVIEAINIDLAKAQIERNGIKISKIKKQPIELFPQRIKEAEITLLARQLATMAHAGVPIIRALDTIMESSKNTSFKKLLIQIKQSVESGNSFSDTLKMYPKYFDKLFCSLCAAGEESGTLDVMLDRVASHRESVQSIKKKVKKALTYPVMVIGVAIIVTWVLLNYAVPAFANIFISSGTKLPAITKITIDISEFSQKYWWILVVIVVAIIVLFKVAKKRYPKVQVWIDYTLLKVPVLGKVIQKSSLARFARTLETTSSAGMPLLEALTTVANATGNSRYEKATLFIRDEVSKGRTMLHAASETHVFPGLMLQMISVGEESGQVEEMLANIAKIYEEDVDVLVTNLSSALEPIIMIILGCIVGFLVVSMYVPMFNLGEAL
ncbi:type II secretion system F family protein [Cysteiniphilum sp. QT6929]|uniref:type II secretion system F family protein n=1 Tax=Cysteiniphilum sp. QT6929 TaxID=2975055 RepID=UPI0024B35DD7|nr:type II secretion system F family protein [Cysteiniphilum sp. QT6929]WHN65066.1 type II secretion system F family protein [Cysteiniphilum sp. QT6929]